MEALVTVYDASGGREVHVATVVGSPYTDASGSSFLDVQGTYYTWLLMTAHGRFFKGTNSLP